MDLAERTHKLAKDNVDFFQWFAAWVDLVSVSFHATLSEQIKYEYFSIVDDANCLDKRLEQRVEKGIRLRIPVQLVPDLRAKSDKQVDQWILSIRVGFSSKDGCDDVGTHTVKGVFKVPFLRGIQFDGFGDGLEELPTVNNEQLLRILGKRVLSFGGLRVVDNVIGDFGDWGKERAGFDSSCNLVGDGNADVFFRVGIKVLATTPDSDEFAGAVVLGAVVAGLEVLLGDLICEEFMDVDRIGTSQSLAWIKFVHFGVSGC